MIEMDWDAVEIVGPEGARLASFLPVRTKHEVIDDELGAPFKKIGERASAIWPFKSIGFLDSLPGQGHSAARQRITLTRELLLRGKQLEARVEPIFALLLRIRCLLRLSLCRFLRHWYLYFGRQSAAPSGRRSKKCQTEQKSSPGPNDVSVTRTIFSPCFLNTDTPGSQPSSPR